MRAELRNLGVIFTFDAKIKNNTKKVKFYRDLYGHNTTSHKKQYSYTKPGILSNIKHLRPTKSTIIVAIKDAPTLKRFFKQNKAKFEEDLIIINERKAKALGLEHPTGWHKIYEEVLGNENTFFSVDF